MITPVGCMECCTVGADITGEGKCPFCLSTRVKSMQDLLETAVEHERFMADMGLASEEEME